MQTVSAAVPGLLCLALLGLAPTAPLPAQECASDGGLARVCGLEIFAAPPGERLSRLDLTRPIVVATGGELEIEIRAFDQFDRSFPRERLSFGTDLEYGCRDLVSVEGQDEPDRLRLRAGTRLGGCRMTLWIPGNLNLEWPLAVEVAGRAHAGYTLADAEYVTQRIYEAALGRRADTGGLANWAPLIAAGDLEGAINGILTSPEFRAVEARTPPAELLDQIYLGVLGRPVDPYGRRNYLGSATAGRYGSIFWDLLTSEEFERRLVAATGGR